MIAYLEQLVTKYKEETYKLLHVEYHVRNDRVTVNTSAEDAFTKKLKKQIEKSGIEPKHIGINYFTDGSILLLKNPGLKILLFGAGEADLCHKANEYVALDKYYKSIEILTSFAFME